MLLVDTFYPFFLTMSKIANLFDSLSGLNRKSKKVKVENIEIKTYHF